MGISVSTSANNAENNNTQEERVNQALDSQNAAGGQRTRLLNDQFYLMFGGPPINYNAFFADTAPMFFFSRPRTEAPPPPPPEVKSTVTIKNDLNLLKRSLRLVPVGVQTSSSSASTLPKQYLLEFEFDTRAPCDVYVHFCANERKDKKNNCIVMIADKQQPFLKRAPIPPQRFTQPSLGQKYRSPMEYPIDFSTCKLSDLEYSEQTDPFKYPIVIELRSPGPTPTETKYQFTYASIYQSNDGMFLIKPLKQKIQVNGYLFELADIYGIEQHSGSENQAAPAASSESATTTVTPQPNIEPTQSEDDRLCVICISEQTDTAVLPCRHMCLCLDCAKMLRMQTNKCPICRAVIESIIQIPGAKRENTENSQTEQEQAKGKEPLQLNEDTKSAYSLE